MKKININEWTKEHDDMMNLMHDRFMDYCEIKGNELKWWNDSLMRSYGYSSFDFDKLKYIDIHSNYLGLRCEVKKDWGIDKWEVFCPALLLELDEKDLPDFYDALAYEIRVNNTKLEGKKEKRDLKKLKREIKSHTYNDKKRMKRIKKEIKELKEWRKNDCKTTK